MKDLVASLAAPEVGQRLDGEHKGFPARVCLWEREVERGKKLYDLEHKTSSLTSL